MFLEKGKKYEVIPLSKQEDHKILNNNRPISPLPAVSKICERAALNQLIEYTAISIYVVGSKPSRQDRRGIWDLNE